MKKRDIGSNEDSTAGHHQKARANEKPIAKLTIISPYCSRVRVFTFTLLSTSVGEFVL